MEEPKAEANPKIVGETVGERVELLEGVGASARHIDGAHLMRLATHHVEKELMNAAILTPAPIQVELDAHEERHTAHITPERQIGAIDEVAVAAIDEIDGDDERRRRQQPQAGVHSGGDLQKKRRRLLYLRFTGSLSS